MFSAVIKLELRGRYLTLSRELIILYKKKVYEEQLKINYINIQIYYIK